MFSVQLRCLIQSRKYRGLPPAARNYKFSSSAGQEMLGVCLLQRRKYKGFESGSAGSTGGSPPAAKEVLGVCLLQRRKY